MNGQVFEELLVSQQADGPALTASNVATSILLAQARQKLSGGYLWRIGQMMKVRAHGRVSNIVTTPGTLTLDLRFGPTSNIIIASGGAMALNVVAKTNVPWFLEWDLTLRSVGNGVLAAFMHQGRWWSESVIGAPAPSAGGVPCHMLPNAAPAVGTGFDSTADGIIDLFATWSLSNANSIQVHGLSVTLSN